MDAPLKNKILESLQKDVCQKIIKSSDFYFQKAQNTLNKFLEIEVNEERKEFLLANKKEYSELKQLFEDSEDLREFGSILLSLISYCDSNAYKKNELNQYEDKRVLALAFVRMNNWIEQLLTYKFEGQLIDGSIKNAIEYLQNPIDNFTMLSENHRSQISENLFKKKYDKNTFKEDFISFFSEVSIRVENPLNYTHLLTRISYFIDSEWKESVIGLISPDGTGWQVGAINDIQNGNCIALWNHKQPNGTNKTLKLLRQCIEDNGYFRIFYTSNYEVQYIAEIVDFVTNQNELTHAKWTDNYDEIEWYHDNFSEYSDGNKSANWVYLARKVYSVNSSDYLDFKYLKPFGYPSVGCQAPVVCFKNSMELKSQENMENKKKLLKYKKQIILQGPPGTGKTREAKEIAKEMLGLSSVEELKNNEQFKLIQFHPSYTYEDFVRGIVAKPNPDGKGILYEAENKTLGEFAEKALENYLDSKKDNKTVSKEIKVKELFDSFIEHINDEIEKQNDYFPLTDNVGLISSNDVQAFRYKGKNEGWLKNGNRMLYKDILQAYFDGNKDRQDLKKNKNISGLARQHASYFVRVLNMFQDFIKDENFDTETEEITEKPYILIIDEINRANLSSVLGELIYALEYRGKALDGMYEIEDSINENKRQLVLPPNLYIIGTMNTADRSVGHIDYAIRRRFAFVEVLPTALQDNDEIYFNTNDFNKVSALFNSDNVSSEFDIKDVQIGHSYFIVKKEEVSTRTEAEPIFKMKMEYEVIPILLEYVKDGVLKGEDIKKKIEDLKPSL